MLTVPTDFLNVSIKRVSGKTPVQVIACEFGEIFTNDYFVECIWATASDNFRQQKFRQQFALKGLFSYLPTLYSLENRSSIFFHMTDNSELNCLILKSCKNYFKPLFEFLRIFISTETEIKFKTFFRPYNLCIHISYI